MNAIREFVVRFNLEADESKIDSVERRVAGFVVTLGDVVNVAKMAAGALRDMALGAVDVASAAVDNADRIGASVEATQELAFAAEQSGASFESVATGLKSFRAALDAARTGSAAAVEVFSRLGLDPAAIGDDPVEQLAAVADALAGLSDETERSALAQDVLGRGAQALRPLLKDGGAGVRALSDEFRRLGLGIGEVEARRLEALGDRLDVVRRLVGGLRNEVGLALLPTMESWTESTIEFVRRTREGEGAVGGFIARFGGVGPILKLAAAALGSIAAVFAAQKLIGAISAVTASLRAMGVAGLFAGAVPLLAGAAILGLVIAAEDFYTFLNDGDSILGRIIEKFGADQADDPPILRWARSLLRTFTELRDMMRAGILAPLEALGFLPDSHKAMAAAVGATSTTGFGASNRQTALDYFGAGFGRQIATALAPIRYLTGNAPAAPDVGWHAPMRAPLWAAPGPEREARAVVNVANDFKIYTDDPRGAAFKVRETMGDVGRQFGRELDRATPVPAR